MLPVSSFSVCSWAECDVDKGRPVATRNVLECANLLLEGVFSSLIRSVGLFENSNGDAPSRSMIISPCSAISPLVCPFALTCCNHIARGGHGFFCFHIFFLSLYSRGFSRSSFLASVAGAFSSCLAFFFHFLLFLKIFLLS